ncbi:MAG TPA: polysaccharide biosynthesis tyrosine autokinase [Pyrinomonadaceae bacterium]
MKKDSDLTKHAAKNGTLRMPAEGVMALLPYAYNNSSVADEGENRSSDYLRDYWYALRRHFLLVTGITVFATLAVAAFEGRQPDQYEAVARIEVGREDTIPELNNRNAVTVSGSDDSVYFNTQLQILTSSGLLRRVVKTLDLEHNENFLHPNLAATHSTWRGLFRMVGLGGKDKQPLPRKEVLLATHVASATATEDLEEAKRLDPYVESVLKGLKIEPIKENRTEVRETRLIDITFNHNDPQITARVVNAVADAAVYMNLERKSEKSAMAGDFLEKRIAELQTQIRRGEEQLLSYAKDNKIISLDASQNTVVERLTGLNRELLEAENERSQAESAYRAALAPDAAYAMSREVDKQAADGERKLADLRQRRAQLLVESTEEWPEVKEIDKQILELEKQIKEQRQTAASTMLKTLETRYRQTVAREQSLRAAFDQQRSITIAQNQAAINYNIIQQEIETNKGILNALLQHSKENDIAKASLSNSVHVINYATVPGQPVGPKRLRNVGLAFILSLGLGIFCALMREHFDNTLRSIAQIEKKLRVPALAVVPSAEDVMGHRLLSTMRPSTLIRSGQPRSELLLNNPNPVMAEIYQHLRVSLLLSQGGCALKSLLVTSSLPGEGKTTTAINTAVCLAESGANVLLIDADLRRPILHKIFEMDNERGLSTALSNGLATSDLLGLIKKTTSSELSVLTSGPQPANPSRLFDHERVRQLIATLGQNFTHIIIDSPPIVPFADSVILSAQVDGVLMVVEGGKSPQDIVVRSMKLLDEVDASVLGVVLNNTKVQPFDNYYATYYAQYYQSGELKDAAFPGTHTLNLKSLEPPVSQSSGRSPEL